MTYENQYVTAHLDSTPDRENVEALFERLFEDGFATTEPEAGGTTATIDDISETLEEAASGNNVSIRLWYFDDTLESPFEVSVRFLDGEPSPYVVTMAVSAYYLDTFAERDEIEEITRRCDAIKRFGKHLYDILDPLHVESRRDFDVIDMRTETPFPTLRVDGVDVDCPLDWYAIFKPDVIERIGTEWTNGVRIHRKEELEDGALLLMLTERPDDTELDEIQDSLATAISKPESWSRG